MLRFIEILWKSEALSKIFPDSLGARTSMVTVGSVSATAEYTHMSPSLLNPVCPAKHRPLASVIIIRLLQTAQILCVCQAQGVATSPT